MLASHRFKLSGGDWAKEKGAQAQEELVLSH